MAIKKNLLWDTSDDNNRGELLNTNKYYSNLDFVYGNDLNLLLAPLTHALQYYPLYDTELLNNKPQRLTYNDYLLAAYNNETNPTMFRLSYQDTNNTYSGNVNVVFDNQSGSNYHTNLIIDGNYYGKEATLTGDVNFDTDKSLKDFYDDVNYTYSGITPTINRYVRNVIHSQDNYATTMLNHLALVAPIPNTMQVLKLMPKDASSRNGTLYLKPGTMATEDYVDNKFTRTSNGWMTLDAEHKCDYYMGASSTDKVYELKGIYLIEFRNNDGDCDHISTTVMIDTDSNDWDIRNHPSSFPNNKAEIGVGGFTPAGNDGFDAYVSLNYDDSVNGMGYYFKCNGCPRGRTSGERVIALVYDRVRITKLFSL